MRKFLLGASLCLAGLIPAASSAVILSYTEDFAGQLPVFHRPAEGASNNEVSGLSGVGTQFPYSARNFTVPTTGSYTIRSTQNLFDGVIVLYGVSSGTAFNPADPLTNAVAIDDDEASTICDPDATCYSLINDTGGVLTLNAGWNYTLVTAAFDSLDSISSSGVTIQAIDPSFTNTVEDVPEPSTVVLMSAGVGALAWLRRRSG